MFRKLKTLINSDTADKWTAMYKLLSENNCLDKQYSLHTENIENIDNLSIDDIYARLTWILRGERFCEGLFDSMLENGTIAKLIDRGIQLC